MAETLIEDIGFAAADGWPLAGTLFHSQAEATHAVMMSAGTGFPRRFYRHFAQYLTGRGALVLTYDYRGIGGSFNAGHGFANIEYSDWGRYDMSAAVDVLARVAGDLPLAHVAHSVGGHFLGLMPNQSRLLRHAFLSIGTGYWGGHHWRNIPKELYFWWGLGSYSLWRHKAVMPIGGWQGEALPPRLFRTWRRWSHRRGYFQPDLEGALQPQAYAEVNAPIRSWIFSDDPIATRASGRDLLAVYPSADTELVVRSPREYGVNRIGHEGAFRLGREALWDEVSDWLECGL
ncbi:serine aminopeptidase domain-containing protein [Tritonibacter scottomollicae]|uniref:alpha/beta hydrolase family protein n=1 Tax=Tritonibacter scottomollicae TaxID=483013 RepID=UPI003AA81FD6